MNKLMDVIGLCEKGFTEMREYKREVPLGRTAKYILFFHSNDIALASFIAS